MSIKGQLYAFHYIDSPMAGRLFLLLLLASFQSIFLHFLPGRVVG